MKLALSILAATLLPCCIASVANADMQVHYRVNGIMPVVEPEVPASSCLDLKTKKPQTASGVHAITMGGNSFDVYCDMETAGGGWTMVVAQYEHDPVTNWNEGIQSDYDPSLATQRTFVLSSTQIPSHTQTGFSQGLKAAVVDYATFQYSTGNIPKTLLMGTKGSYHVARHSDHYYDWHDPEAGVANHPDWNQTLTFDQTGGRLFSWSFAPFSTDPSGRGYGLNGMQAGVADTFAWTVWVR